MRLMESHNYSNWFHYSSTQQQHLPHAKSSNNYAKSNFFNDNNKFKNQNELNFGRKINSSATVSSSHQSLECSPERDSQSQLKKKKKKSPFSFQDVVKSYSCTSEEERDELLSWLEGELEARGIDPVVYGRYVLALLEENTGEESSPEAEKDYGSVAASGKSLSRSMLFNSSSASQPASPLTPASGISRLCEHHQRFYPSINSRNKLSTRAKENPQKASSTTKWMHKRYLQSGQQQGILMQANVAKCDISPKTLSIDEFEVDHNCPDCQRTKGSTEHRKMVVLKCLKTATESELCNGIESFVDDICFKFDKWQKQQKGETGKHRVIQPMNDNKGKSTKFLNDSSNELIASDPEWDSRPDYKTRSSTDLLQPSYMQSLCSINDDNVKRLSKSCKDRKTSANQPKLGNNLKYFTNKYQTSYSSNSSEYGDVYDKKDGEEPSDSDNNNVTGNRREQHVTSYRSTSEDHTSINGNDEWSKQPARQQVRDQALKYFAAFPALNISSSTSSTSSTQNLNSPRSAKMSQQSSLDDSVFLETSSNSAVSTDLSTASPSKTASVEPTNSWNGQKIIKNIVSKSKSQIEHSIQSFNSNSVTPVPVINSLGVSEKHMKLLKNSIGSMIKTRTSAPSTLDNLTTNFTTLKKKSLTTSVSTSRKTTETEEKQQASQSSDNNATSSNLAPSSVAAAIPSKEQEKIFNIMPSFLNPLKSSTSVVTSSAPVVSSASMNESRSHIFSKLVKSSDTSEVDTASTNHRSYVNSTADQHHHSNYQKQSSSFGNNSYGNNHRRRNQQQRSSVSNTTVTKSINKSLSYSDQPFRKSATSGNPISGDSSTSRSRFITSTSSVNQSGSGSTSVTSTLSQPRHSNDSPSIVDLLPNFLRPKVQPQQTGREQQVEKESSGESGDGGVVVVPPPVGGASMPADRTLHTDHVSALARQDTLADKATLVTPQAATASTVNIPPMSTIDVLNQKHQQEQDASQYDLLNLFHLLSTKNEDLHSLPRTSHLNGYEKFENAAAASLLADDLLNNNKNRNSLIWEPTTQVQQSFPSNLTNMFSTTSTSSLFENSVKSAENTKSTNTTFVNLDQPILSSSINDNYKSLDLLLDTYLLDRSSNSSGFNRVQYDDWKSLGNLSISPSKSMDSNYRDNQLKRDYVSYLWNQNCTLRYMDFINDNVDIFNWLSSSKSLSDTLPSESKFNQQNELQKELSMITELQKLHLSQKTNINEETFTSKPFISLENHEMQHSAFSEVIPNKLNDRSKCDPLRNMISLGDISDDEEIFDLVQKPLNQTANQDLWMFNHSATHKFSINENRNIFSSVFEQNDLPLKTPSNCACKDNCSGHFLVSACCCAHDEYHSRLDLLSFRHSDKSTNTETDSNTFVSKKTKVPAEFDSCLLNFDELVNDVLRIADDETANVSSEPISKTGVAFESLIEISQKVEGNWSTLNDGNRSQADSKNSTNDSDENDLPPMPYSKRHKLKKNDHYGKLPEDMVVIKPPTKPSSSNSTFFNGNYHQDFSSTTANSTNMEENPLSYDAYDQWLDYEDDNNEENQLYEHEYYYNEQNGEHLPSYYGADDANMIQLEPCGNDLYHCDGYLLNLKSIQTSNSDEVEDGNKDSNLYSNIKFKSDNRSIGITTEVPKQIQKPCTFYMEGFCARGDCKFSHDLASIPCKYWLEGYCIKDTLCPFLHAYPENQMSSQNSKLDPNAKSFQFKIESDSDFPSLFAEDEPVSAMNGIDKSTHTQGRVHFDFSKSSGLKIKMRDLSKQTKNQAGSNYARLFVPNKNKKNKGSDSSMTPPDKKTNQSVVATEDEWPSLGDEFPALSNQPVNQAITKSNLQSSDARNSIKFRDKVLKSNNARGNSQNQASSSTTKTMGVFPLKSVL